LKNAEQRLNAGNLMDEPAKTDPVVLEAFMGKAPLATARGCFGSQGELLRAYARMQAMTFGAEAAHRENCDLCQRVAEPVAWVEVEWEARLKWHLWRLLWVIPAVPVVLLLTMAHLGVLLHLGGDKLRLEIVETVPLTTWYSVCKSCRRGFWWREKMYLAFYSLGMLTLLVSGCVAAFFGVLLAGGPWGAFDMPLGLWPTVGVFSVSVGLLILVSTLGRRMLNRFNIPPAVRRMVKRPFYGTGFEIHREPSR
jgi:hypothetical protein